jgi:hypothetical protein
MLEEILLAIVSARRPPNQAAAFSAPRNTRLARRVACGSDEPMSLPRWPLFFPLGVLPLLACSDTPATSVVLALRVDPALAGAIDHVELHVFRPSEGSLKLEHCFPAGSCTTGAAGAAGAGGAASLPASLPELPGTLALYPESKDDLSTPLLVVLEGKAGGVTKVSRRARMSFVKEKSKVLRLDLSAACLPVDCSQAATHQADMTCAGGQCIPTAVAPDALPDFTDTSTALDPAGFSGSGGAGQGGAGMAGQGGAGMAGAGGCHAGVVASATIVDGSAMLVEDALQVSVKVSFPTSMTVSTDHPISYHLLDDTQSVVVSGMATASDFTFVFAAERCRPGVYSLKIDDACVPDAILLKGNVPVVGSFVGGSVACDVTEMCGTRTKPWCDVTSALTKPDPTLRSTSLKLLGSAAPYPPFEMVDGVDIEGGFAPGFNGKMGVTTIQQQGVIGDGKGVVTWPSKVTAQLTDVTIAGDASGADSTSPSQLIAVASSATATLTAVTVSPTGASKSHDVAAIRGVRDQTDPTAGSLSLQNCTIQAPDALFPVMQGVTRSRSVGVQTVRDMSLTIGGGQVRGGLVQVPGGSSVPLTPLPLSVGVEHLGGGVLSVGKGALAGGANLQARATEGGLAIGLRATKAQTKDPTSPSVSIDGATIDSSPGSDPIPAAFVGSRGIALGPVEQLDLPEDFSPGDPLPGSPEAAQAKLYQITRVRIQSTKATAWMGSDSSIALSVAGVVPDISLSGSIFTSPGMQPIGPGHSRGIRVVGPAATDPKTVLNATSTEAYGGQHAIIDQIGAELSEVEAHLTDCTFRGAGIPNQPEQGGPQSKALVLRADQMLDSEVIGGTFLGVSAQGGGTMEAGGITIDVASGVSISNAKMAGGQVLVTSSQAVPTPPLSTGLHILRGTVRVTDTVCDGGQVASINVPTKGESHGLLMDSGALSGGLILQRSTFHGGQADLSTGADLRAHLVGAEINASLFDGVGQSNPQSVSYGLRTGWLEESWLSNSIALGGISPDSYGYQLTVPPGATGSMNLVFNLFHANSTPPGLPGAPTQSTAALLDIPADLDQNTQVHFVNNTLLAVGAGMSLARWLVLPDSLVSIFASTAGQVPLNNPFRPDHCLFGLAQAGASPCFLWSQSPMGQATCATFDIGGALTTAKAEGFEQDKTVTDPVTGVLTSEAGAIDSCHGSGGVCTREAIAQAISKDCTEPHLKSGKNLTSQLMNVSNPVELADLTHDILSTVNNPRTRVMMDASSSIGPLDCNLPAP